MKRILILSERRFPLKKLERYFFQKRRVECSFLQTKDLNEASEFMINMDHPVMLLVADLKIEGALPFLAELRNEELFTYLPVLALIDDESDAHCKQLWRVGCQHHLNVAQLRSLFVEKIASMINFTDKIYRLEKRMINLQDKAIRDFILLDIIKNYIPRTIWRLAENFAEKQVFSIPENELELAVCFGDICQFSSYSQYRRPKEVITMLNLLFEVVTRYVHFFDGDIDKFVGDAFLGVFGDLKLALLAMFGIQREIKKRNAIEPQLMNFRIGVHTGKVIRGNVGGNHRFDNTLIGDTVNTASRLEGKASPGGIVVSEEVRHRLKLEIPVKYRLVSELKGRRGEEVYWNIFDYLEDHPTVFAEMEQLEQVPSAS